MAYCFDEAVDYFGTEVEAELAKVVRGKKESSESYARKQTLKLHEILARGAKKPEVEKQYAAPVARRWKGGKNG